MDTSNLDLCIRIFSFFKKNWLNYPCWNWASWLAQATISSGSSRCNIFTGFSVFGWKTPLSWEGEGNWNLCAPFSETINCNPPPPNNPLRSSMWEKAIFFIFHLMHFFKCSLLLTRVLCKKWHVFLVDFQTWKSLSSCSSIIRTTYSTVYHTLYKYIIRKIVLNKRIKYLALLKTSWKKTELKNWKKNLGTLIFFWGRIGVITRHRHVDYSIVVSQDTRSDKNVHCLILVRWVPGYMPTCYKRYQIFIKCRDFLNSIMFCYMTSMHDNDP